MRKASLSDDRGGCADGPTVQLQGSGTADRGLYFTRQQHDSPHDNKTVIKIFDVPIDPLLYQSVINIIDMAQVWGTSSRRHGISCYFMALLLTYLPTVIFNTLFLFTVKNGEIRHPTRSAQRRKKNRRRLQ